MLPVTLPASLAVLLGTLRPCFTAPSFRTFCGLAAGLAGTAAPPPEYQRPAPPQGRAAGRPAQLAATVRIRDTPVTALTEPYAARWSIEQAFADARNIPGAGEARNRARRAVERTVPFALLIHTLVIIWYTRHGHHRADITGRRHARPWYHAKTEPAFEDMLTQLRRVLITARISKGSTAHPTREQTNAVLVAWHAAAA
jgi:hypothetical protein